MSTHCHKRFKSFLLIFYREDWKPVLTINSIIYGLQYLFLVSTSILHIFSNLNHGDSGSTKNLKKRFVYVANRKLHTTAGNSDCLHFYTYSGYTLGGLLDCNATFVLCLRIFI